MTRVEKVKDFAEKHPYITIAAVGLYSAVLALCLVRDLYHYGILKK